MSQEEREKVTKLVRQKYSQQIQVVQASKGVLSDACDVISVEESARGGEMGERKRERRRERETGHHEMMLELSVTESSQNE